MDIKRSVMGVLFMLLSGVASAGAASSGTISKIYFLPDGKVIFTHSGARTNAPSCAQSGSPQRWGFDSSTAGGRSQLSGLLAAHATKTPIQINGTGACSIWTDSETMYYIVTAD